MLDRRRRLNPIPLPAAAALLKLSGALTSAAPRKRCRQRLMIVRP